MERLSVDEREVNVTELILHFFFHSSILIGIYRQLKINILLIACSKIFLSKYFPKVS